MMKFLSAIAFALAISTPALGEEHADVVKKCTVAMTSIGAENVDAGCACFADALTEEERAEYTALDLSTWDNAASETLKEKGGICFPQKTE